MQSNNDSQATETVKIPTSILIPRSLHSRVKVAAGLKRVNMSELILEGIELALQSERFRPSEDERRAFGGQGFGG